MKYWAYLVAKLALAGVFLYGLRRTLAYLIPAPKPLFNVVKEPFGHDLLYTLIMFVYALVAAGVVWLAVWDQRYRCRTCLRRLRMPILTGNWTHILLGRPRTEYICPFGHGTLKSRRSPDHRSSGSRLAAARRHVERARVAGRFQEVSRLIATEDSWR